MGKINQSEKKKISMLAALVIAVLSFGSFVTVMNATGNAPFGISSVFADEGEDDEDDDKDEDEDEDEDKDEDEDDDKDDQKKEAEKKAKELAKEKAKKDRELLKKQADDMRNSSDDDEDEDDDADELEDEEEDEEDEEEDELNKKRAEILEDIYEDIIEAEEDIMKAQAEGVDVTKALATLALAKEKVTSDLDDALRSGKKTILFSGKGVFIRIKNNIYIYSSFLCV